MSNVQGSTVTNASDLRPSASAEPVDDNASGLPACSEPCDGCTVLVESDRARVPAARPLRADERALLVEIFHSYLRSPDCLADPEHAEVRAVGTRVPDISDVRVVIDGSFTAPGTKQTLISFFMGHCGLMGSHAEHYGRSVLVLIEDGKVVTVNDGGPTTAIELIPIDVENDGVSEVLAFSADYASGTTFSEAELWSWIGEPRSRGRFELSRDTCLLPDGEHFESTLLASFDATRQHRCFLQRRRTVPCPNP